jgi:hypothetical protein
VDAGARVRASRCTPLILAIDSRVHGGKSQSVEWNSCGAILATVFWRIRNTENS